MNGQSYYIDTLVRMDQNAQIAKEIKNYRLQERAMAGKPTSSSLPARTVAGMGRQFIRFGTALQSLATLLMHPSSS